MWCMRQSDKQQIILSIEMIKDQYTSILYDQNLFMHKLACHLKPIISNPLNYVN